MRLRLLVSTISVLLLLVLIGAPTVLAQQSLAERNQSWGPVVRVNPVVTLCHIPPGNPGNAHTIEVGQAAVPAHLAHGDTLGECAGECPPYPAMVPQTGQTECWDQDGNLIDCAGTGQDGDYQAGAAVNPRFTDNGDGTVTDNLTGLIWLQDANCFSIQTWANALSAANTLASASDACTPDLTDGSVAGDWRLPNIRELHSLIDYGAFNYATSDPLLPPGHPFFRVDHQYTYWSSTTNEEYPRGAFIVTLDEGFGGSYGKDGPYVRMWPVRSPE